MEIFRKENERDEWFVESGCLRVQPKTTRISSGGGKLHLKLNMQRETDSEQVP